MRLIVEGLCWARTKLAGRRNFEENELCWQGQSFLVGENLKKMKSIRQLLDAIHITLPVSMAFPCHSFIVIEYYKKDVTAFIWHSFKVVGILQKRFSWHTFKVVGITLNASG